MSIYVQYKDQVLIKVFNNFNYDKVKRSVASSNSLFFEFEFESYKHYELLLVVESFYRKKPQYFNRKLQELTATCGTSGL